MVIGSVFICVCVFAHVIGIDLVIVIGIDIVVVCVQCELLLVLCVT